MKQFWFLLSFLCLSGDSIGVTLDTSRGSSRNLIFISGTHVKINPIFSPNPIYGLNLVSVGFCIKPESTPYFGFGVEFGGNVGESKYQHLDFGLETYYPLSETSNYYSTFKVHIGQAVAEIDQTPIKTKFLRLELMISRDILAKSTVSLRSGALIYSKDSPLIAKGFYIGMHYAYRIKPDRR